NPLHCYSGNYNSNSDHREGKGTALVSRPCLRIGSFLRFPISFYSHSPPIAESYCNYGRFRNYLEILPRFPDRPTRKFPAIGRHWNLGVRTVLSLLLLINGYV